MGQKGLFRIVGIQLRKRSISEPEYLQVTAINPSGEKIVLNRDVEMMHEYLPGTGISTTETLQGKLSFDAGETANPEKGRREKAA